MRIYKWFLIAALEACAPGAGVPAAYGAELAACTENSKTLQESIDCENRVRAAYGRPPRDGGTDGSR